MENQEEKGEVMEFKHAGYRSDKIYTSESNDKYVVSNLSADRDVDIQIMKYSLFESGWHYCATYDVYIVKIEENVLRFQHSAWDDKGRRVYLWKEVILKEEQ